MRQQSKHKDSEANGNSDSLVQEAVATLVRSQRKRVEPPLTQEELAYRSGISFEHLNHIENGKAAPSIEVLYRIAKALGFHRLSEFLLLDDRGIL